MATSDYNNEKYLFETPPPEQAISIMKKPPNKRSVRETALLINYIQRANLMIFQADTGSNSSVRDLIAKALPYFQLVNKEVGTALFHKDQYVETLYIMIKGSARGFDEKTVEEIEADNKQKQEFMTPAHSKVKRPQRQMSIAEEHAQMTSPSRPLQIEIFRIPSDLSHSNTPFTLNNTPRNAFLKNGLSNNNFSFSFVESFEEKIFSGFRDRHHQYYSGSNLKMKQVAMYSDGSIIGERAFFSEEGVAFTTVITYESCYFLTLGRKDYDLVFAEEMLKMKDKISFLERVFPQTTRSQLAMLSYCFEKMVCRTDQVIYKQEQEAKAVYLVVKGEIQLFRSIIVESSAKVDKVLVKDKKTVYKSAALNDGELFGEEIFSTKKKYLFTTKVTNLGTIIYRVDEKSLERMKIVFTTFYEGLQKMLKIKALARETALKEYCRAHGLYQDYNAFFMSLKEQQDTAREKTFSINPQFVSKAREYPSDYVLIPKKPPTKLTSSRLLRESTPSNGSQERYKSRKTSSKLRQGTRALIDLQTQSISSNPHFSDRLNTDNEPSFSDNRRSLPGKIKDQGNSLFEEYGLTMQQSEIITKKRDSDAMFTETKVSKKKSGFINTLDFSLSLSNLNNFEKFVESPALVQDSKKTLYEKLKIALMGTESDKSDHETKDAGVFMARNLGTNSQLSVTSRFSQRKLSEKSIIEQPSQKKRLASWDSICIHPPLKIEKKIHSSKNPSLTARRIKRSNKTEQ